MASVKNENDDLYDYESAARIFKEKYPLAWAKVCPRRYSTPLNFDNPRKYSVSMIANIIAATNPKAMKPSGSETDESNSALITSVLCAHYLVDKMVPTYFVAEDFCRAAAATQPPEDFTLSHILWPMPSMLLVLPNSFSIEFFGHHVPFISVNKIEGKEHQLKQVGEVPQRMLIRVANDKFCAHASVYFPGFNFGVDYECNWPLSSKISSITDSNDFTSWGELDNLPQTTVEEDTKLANKISDLAIKIMLAMTARPTLVESNSVCDRPVRIKKGQVVREALWSPNFIGKQYTVVRDTPVGTHASPRMHWRRGFMRNQAFGPGLVEHRLVWIDPVLVRKL
jgi:hypothetical protein